MKNDRSAHGVREDAPSVTDAELVSRAADELDDIAEDYKSHGNDSQAASATCRAYELRKVLSRMVAARGVIPSAEGQQQEGG